MMPYRSSNVRSDVPAASPASARRIFGQSGTRTSDLMGSGREPVKICMTPRRPVMQPSPSAWLEQDYDQPDAFERPVFSANHTPTGLFQLKANHISDCYCETGEGEFWTQTPVVMKWRAS